VIAAQGVEIWARSPPSAPPIDLTLAELTIVAFYPADPQTAEALTEAVSQAYAD
jgi:hypothetical protein